jgi:hypothetical protein
MVGVKIGGRDGVVNHVLSSSKGIAVPISVFTGEVLASNKEEIIG